MPTPKQNETKDQWLNRCIPVVVSEGKAPDQATAICISMWENKAVNKLRNESSKAKEHRNR